eukprot:30990-Pelagococcus_subviridis.AAC.6
MLLDARTKSMPSATMPGSRWIMIGTCASGRSARSFFAPAATVSGLANAGISRPSLTIHTMSLSRMRWRACSSFQRRQNLTISRSHSSKNSPPMVYGSSSSSAPAASPPDARRATRRR